MGDTDTQPTRASLDEYLRAQVAPRFQELVQAAEQRLAAAQRELDDLRAATATIAWEVAGATPQVGYVNLANGAMVVAEQPAAEPLMTVSQSAADWARFRGGMAGLVGGDSRRPFGKSRIERLRSIRGAARFVITGLPDGGEWSCTVYFGPAPRPAAPQTVVTLPATVVRQVQSGQLEPQLAFMQGLVKIAGDAGFAMQLGMALFL